MKRIIFLLLIVFLSKIKAQSFDSLLLEVNQINHDSDKINLLYKQGFEKRAINPQYSYDCAKTAEKIAQQLSLPYYTAKVNNLLGILFYRKGEFKKAITYHLNALNLRTIINDKKGIGLSSANLGNAYSDLKNYSLAEKYYLQALQINNELKDITQISNCLINLGSLAATQRKDDVALEYFNTTLVSAKENNDYHLQGIILNNIAVIKMNLGLFDESIGLSFDAIKAKDLSDNEIEKADSYLNIALSYLFLKDFKQTEKYLMTCDSIITKYNYVSAKLNYLQIKHQYLNNIKDYQNAYQTLLRHNQLNDSILIANSDAKIDNDFNEYISTKEFSKPVQNSKTGIYWFFGCMILMAIILFLIILKFKR
ncbi:MAG: tetratricopeptide repeat protein [Bacteroidetes bacterium]|nr:tetratricopeptide repeat protein [Bacteroidota bacterium]